MVDARATAAGARAFATLTAAISGRGHTLHRHGAALSEQRLPFSDDGRL